MVSALLNTLAVCAACFSALCFHDIYVRWRDKADPVSADNLAVLRERYAQYENLLRTQGNKVLLWNGDTLVVTVSHQKILRAQLALAIQLDSLGVGDTEQKAAIVALADQMLKP